MWFALLGIALTVVVTGGLYFRWRLTAALQALGAGPKALGRFRWALLWLLFGYPLLVFLFVFIAMALGGQSVSLTASGPPLWLIAYPFWLTVLTMLQSVPYFLALDFVRMLAARGKGKEATPRWWAIACLLVVAAFAIYTPARVIAERETLRVHRYQVGSGSGAPFRIVFLGDLQQDSQTDQARADEVVARVNEEKADLIICAGDWINTGADYIKAAAETGGKLQSRLGTMSVMGDHEHFAYRDRERSAREVGSALQSQQVELITNEIRWFDHAGERIAILFLDYNYIYRTPPDQVRTLLEAVRDADYAVVVTHQFDASLAELVKGRVDLVLAGHTHGGQVNPVLGFRHVSLARVETCYVEGRYRIGERTVVIVTAGIGFSIAPFRYASPASIEVIEVRPDGAGRGAVP